MKPTVRTAVTVILLSVTTRSLGYLKLEVVELISFALFIALLSLILLPFRRGNSWLKNVFLLAIILILVWVFGELEQIARIALVAATLSAAAINSALSERARGECAVLGLASFIFGLYRVGLMHSDYLWHLTERLSLSYSHFAAGLVNQDLLLGATASGLHNCALFMILMLSAFAMSERRSPLYLIAALLAPPALMGAFIIGGAAWKGFVPIAGQAYELNHLDLQIVLILAGLIVLWAAAPSGPARWLPFLPWGRVQILSVAGPAALLAGVFILACPSPAKERGKRVLLYDRGHVMWMHPVFGWYGDKSGGMFGNLPRYLDFRGFEAKRDTISEESLRGVDLLVIINLAEPFTEEEHRLTWDFVESGGALLCLGDHTGMGSIREPFNALLDPVGIRFKFDSAKGFSESWVNGMEWRPHETTRVVKDENSTQIWTGASLDLDWSAEPVIVGKFAWSDSGDAENARRSYLGDFKYNHGELLSDVVLVAEARYGKGKVLVFGDTSTFQNGALVLGDEFAHACVQWLCKVERDGALERIRTPLGLALLATAAISFFLAGLSYTGIILFPLSLLASPLVTAFTGSPPARSGTPEELVAYIDKAHGEWFDLNSWNKDSIGGLSYNLMRNGFLPFVLREFSGERLRESDLMLVSAPTRNLSNLEIEFIDGFVKSGAVLIVNMGYEQYKMAPALLNHFGFSLRNVPLGRLETEGLGVPVRFYDAYPLDCGSSDTTVVSRGYGYPVAVILNHGEGRVVAMGDSRFFQNKNLEDRDEYIEENVMFLKELLGALKQEVPGG